MTLSNMPLIKYHSYNKFNTPRHYLPLAHNNRYPNIETAVIQCSLSNIKQCIFKPIQNLIIQPNLLTNYETVEQDSTSPVTK